MFHWLKYMKRTESVPMFKVLVFLKMACSTKSAESAVNLGPTKVSRVKKNSRASSMVAGAKRHVVIPDMR